MRRDIVLDHPRVSIAHSAVCLSVPSLSSPLSYCVLTPQSCVSFRLCSPLHFPRTSLSLSLSPTGAVQHAAPSNSLLSTWSGDFNTLTHACTRTNVLFLSLSLSLSLSFEFAANARCSHTARMIASDPCSLMRHDAKQDRVYIKPRDSILNSKSTFSSSVSHVPDLFFLSFARFLSYVCHVPLFF